MRYHDESEYISITAALPLLLHTTTTAYIVIVIVIIIYIYKEFNNIPSQDTNNT